MWTSKLTSNFTSGSVEASGLSNNTAGFFQCPRLILLSSLGSTKFTFNFVIPFLTPWSVDVLYSAAYTFIDIWRAIPGTKLLSTYSYKLGFHRYGWGSRTFRNITADSIYILIRGWLSMIQLLLEHSWRVTLHPLFFTKTDEQFIKEITRSHIAYCSLLNVSKVIYTERSLYTLSLAWLVSVIFLHLVELVLVLILI